MYTPPNNTNNLYQDFTNEFIPILEYLQRANCETIIAGDFNIDLLKINNNATLGNYFNSVVAQRFFPQITLPKVFRSQLHFNRQFFYVNLNVVTYQLQEL